MELKRNGTQPSARGPAEYFTGTIRVDPLFTAPDPARCTRRIRDFRTVLAQQLAYTSAGVRR